jgi:hypothetical protein
MTCGFEAAELSPPPTQRINTKIKTKIEIKLMLAEAGFRKRIAMIIPQTGMSMSHPAMTLEH